MPGQTMVTLMLQSQRDGLIMGPWQQPALAGPDGRVYAADVQYGSGVGGPVYLSINQRVGNSVTVTIPTLELRQDVQGDIEVPVPQQGSALDLDRSLLLGAWKLDVTRAEIVSEGDHATGLRIYAHSHTQEGATVKLISQCDNTGALTWFEVPVPAGAKHVRIRIKQVQAQINGPWKITLPVRDG